MKSQSRHAQSQYSLDQNGCFVIENYNESKPFSNFFPGVAGVWGVPMWVFFVNRGQCIASFGIEGKDKSILEFQPANKAYRLTSSQGFRTFVKVKSGRKTHYWEPFKNPCVTSPYKVQQVMAINSHDLTIEEQNFTLGITVRVNYFTVSDESFPALVRRVTVTNTSRKKYDIELLDGLPAIVPYGTKDWLIKNLSRTVEAWVKVRNLSNNAPYFQLNVEVSDTPDVTHIQEGNFYFSFDPSSQKSKLLDVLVDSSCVFGNVTDFSFPQKFFTDDKFKLPKVQQTSNRTPCAMSYKAFSLAAKRKKEIVSLGGFALSEKQLKTIIKKVRAKGFVNKKAANNRQLISAVKNYALTNSASQEFNQYCGQNFLDNVLRGGLPVSLETQDGNIAFNVFSRKHGDLERDYNYFVIAPTHFSQGNGNFRDVNQNRRNDVWFNTDVKDSSIINFLSLMQADGYNPLVVKGLSFAVEDEQKIEPILKICLNGDGSTVKERILKGFQPGELLQSVTRNGLTLKVSREEFLSRVLSVCRKQEVAEHGEGFWSDHWTYNLDLIESYFSVYPEKLNTLLLDKKDFSFYHNSHYVLPRDERYYLTEKGVRQYHSVKDGSKEIKAEALGNRLRISNGNGDVYYTHLLAKLLCVITNKAATLDPSGIGIEMEADKPNWYDALNGLPGLLGSSISETLELKRFCLFLLDSFEQLTLGNVKIQIFSELAAFIKKLNEVLSNEKEAVAYWRKSNQIKEKYRSQIRNGIEGTEEQISINEIKHYLQLIIKRVDRAVEQAKDSHGLIRTYFYHEVADYEFLDKIDGSRNNVFPLEFKKHALPIFLEGFVHALRTERNPAKARHIYKSLKKSSLFDKKLKMYKVNSSLEKETEEIGRTRIFPAGWLENESIWLHMEYKYFLELLKSGLYEEFYETFEVALIPFLNPERYGRSTLENSSFIVSSVHEDSNLHGQGFVARLSGSTAEFIDIWLTMNLGKNPFLLNDKNELSLVFQPILKGNLFTRKAQDVLYLDSQQKWKKIKIPQNTYSFDFMGHTLVVYHNPKRRNTFGKNKCQIKAIQLTYSGKRKPVKIADQMLPAIHAHDVRNNKVDRIDVYFE